MRLNYLKSCLKTAVLLTAVLLLGACAAFAQQQINLSAGPTSTVLPDGTVVQMWGYTCGTAVAGSTATCAVLNPNHPANSWSPVVITVPTGEILQINLTNSLSFASGATVPTSLVIVGQLGGGLGTPGGTTPSPAHLPQTLTWPAGSTSLADGSNTPPTQGPRVQSFSTEVAAGATTPLTWAAPRPGTYLLESGTHPSIQGPMGLYGMVVVTCAPGAAVTAACPTAGTAYPVVGTAPAVTYSGDVDLLFSEIDPVQNSSVNTAVNTAGFSETMVWSGLAGGCGDPASATYNQCYPPAVNYKPLYYLINGVSFDKTHAQYSVFPTVPASGITAGTGQVLLRLVNAGLRMHVPSVVGSQTATTAAPGISLIAEDGNALPGIPRVQSEVFMAAGKTYDVMINAPTTTTALPIFDRQGSVSSNATARDAGMLAYIAVNNATLPSTPSVTVAANTDNYASLVSGETLTVSDPAKGVIANDIGVYGVQLLAQAGGGTVTLNANGTFTYVPGGSGTTDSFTYCANGSVTGTTPTCSSGITATVNLTALAAGTLTCTPATYSSGTVATYFAAKTPGLLANCADQLHYKMSVVPTSVPAGTVVADENGGFTVTSSGGGSYTFTYQVKDTAGTTATGTATVVFPAGSGVLVTLVDAATKAELPSPQDYRWIIEEDRTFYVDPNCQTNPLPTACPAVTTATDGTRVPGVFGTNFHTSYMPVIAQGCTGTASCESGQSVLGVTAVCDVGNGACRTDGSTSKTPTFPGDVALDITKRYYLSVKPGDILDAGHDMGGAELVYVNGAWHNALAPSVSGVQIQVEPQQQLAAKISAFVFEDDHPLNGEHDAGGGVDTLSPNEPGLGGFNITILDLAGMSGDAVGQMTYDQFNQPLSNALAGAIDPSTNQDACPVSKDARTGIDTGGGTNLPAPSDIGITGVIPVCPKYEADGVTLSPLAGQAIIVNVPPGRYGVVATPAADRIARGEEWLQTNTLDGGKDLEAFIKTNEPAYFQEFGPASYHVSIGFANPKWINDVGTALCNAPGAACGQTVTGKITGARMSRTPDQRLYSSGTRDIYGYTQCYASLGNPDGEDFAFAKCQDDGTFTLSGIPAGDWKVTIFDQWNDQIVDGISTPIRVGGTTNPPTTNTAWCHGPTTSASICDMGDLGVHGWKNNLYTRSFIDANGNGVSDANEQGLALVSTNIRYKDGSFSNFNSTDLEGFAGFNEVFPIFNWYVLETSSTRYKNTGTHVVNDAGGPVDPDPLNPTPIQAANCAASSGYPPCGHSTILANIGRTHEDFPVPTNLRVPGAFYCPIADCTTAPSPVAAGGAGGSTGRVDPPTAVSYGWQSYMGQNQYIEFGKKPFAPNENGGIQGHVVYSSTRPFDDPQLDLQTSWEPLVPHVTINLYQEGLAADGVTPTLTLVDHTTTSSWDDWAQGFRSDGVPNMNCPGQSTTDPFFYALKDQPNYLDWYNAQHSGTLHPLPNNSQYKCYDGMHSWNQLLPAPYDGMYSFPSVTATSPTTGKPTATNCTICAANQAAPTTDWNYNLPMLPAGKYVVEVVVPQGYELVKEEDKNLLTGDAFTAPVTQQFAGFGNIFILPDQAAVAASYNPNNPLMPTTDQGVTPRHEGDTGSVEAFWPCVGAKRIVPDFLSINPAAGFNTPFAGATRPLCDRKEVTLENESSVLAKFYIFSSADIAAHITGIITDDFTSEFDPFSPAFGEKFSPANLPVAVKDHAGNEVGRLYSDMHGIFNGLTYSSWTVNPPDPSGYTPQMFDMCMNDKGTGVNPDPFYQPSYSQFCYEWSNMPGQTSYLDTPVIPTAAFAPNYNHPDCAYPNGTPAIGEVDGDGVGPYVNGSTNLTLTINTINQVGAQCSDGTTITTLGDACVSSYAYSGPGVTTAPWNQKTVRRHYGFGARPATCGNGANCPDVTIGGISAVVTSWTDTQIVATARAVGQIPLCAVQQQALYGGSQARCGELVIKAANGKPSIDTVTVTIGGKAPTRLTPGQTIQSAIDAAAPGDLIIVPPGTYHELVLMWKPVRLQGVGAASVIIDANTHPSGLLLNDWRRRVVCLFGLAENGVPAGYDPGCAATFGTTWNFFQPTTSNPQVDRLPLEAAVGWDASLNGNLAEQLQEPTLMGAYEGAGITVLSKGVRVPNGADPWTDGATIAAFPAGTAHLTNSSQDCGTTSNPFPSSFYCNPSSIDGLSITNSSQGGGGIFVHGWAHNLQIANNRVYNNEGTLAGGISVGQGEHPDAPQVGSAIITLPGSCITGAGLPTNTQLPLCFDQNVNVHNNAVTMNASEGDELFSATPSGAGGVAFCTGTDNYKFNYNWVCGNLTTGDGAGVTQVGFVWNGDIEHNTILFNQATNPTTPSNGGGLMIMSAPDTDPTCPGPPDADCNHAFGTVGEGIGPGLVVNANLILGNAAEAGAGGGVRFQGVNGLEVGNFALTPANWFTVRVTNNVIADNVAGWDGGGVSLQDAIGVNLINNTIISNDSTASSGTLFGAFFADQASAPTPCPRDALGANIKCVPLSAPQPAGLSAGRHTAEFLASLPATITCPAGHYSTTGSATNGTCRNVSFPILYNDVIWQNRAFNIVVTNPATGSGAQQATVALVPQLSQSTTGACVTGATYWDLGLRGDTGPTNHSSGVTFQPQASVLTSIAGYPGGGTGFRANTAGFSPGVVKQYCNGSKIPPEAGLGGWYQVPPGTNEGNVPIPVFNLTAGATVDEGNNWVNISWGPLSMITPTTETNPATETMLADYSLAAGSPAINYITSASSGTSYTAAPADDFYGNPRKNAGNPGVDAGAVEFTGGGGTVTPPAITSIVPNSAGRGATSLSVTINGTNLTGATAINITGSGLSHGTFTVNAAGTAITTTFTANRAAGTFGAHTVTVVTPGGTSNGLTFTVTTAAVSFAGPTPSLVTGTTTPHSGTVTVTNAAASTGPFTLTAAPVVTKVGAPGGTFAITGGTCTSGASVNPGASCTIIVQYTPGAAGTTTATANVSVTGTGTAVVTTTSSNFTAN